jgi:hypothetical protein
MSKLEIRRRAFSPIKFSVLRNLLRTGAFTDQKLRMGRRLFSLLFSLCFFEKSKNGKAVGIIGRN